jgi:hypothetical protein
MPVAKLSREFYEKFGDKLTDEGAVPTCPGATKRCGD